MFHHLNIQAVYQLKGDYTGFLEDGLIIVSEPLDELKQHWAEVPESTLIIAEQGNVTTLPFEPSMD